MDYVDELKFFCNGINLVMRKYGDCDPRNGLYIIDKESSEVLTDFMPGGKFHIEQNRYIVISHGTDCGIDRITVYDCLKKECLANNYQCRKIMYYTSTHICFFGGLYVVTSCDNKEHLLDFELLGTDKDVFEISAESISLFYKDDNTYQLGISVNDEIKLYDKGIGINDNSELQGYSLVEANVSPCWYGQRIHVLKNKDTKKKYLVSSKFDSGTGKVTYEFDSYECDNIYFFDFYKKMVGSLQLSCFENDGKVSVYYHDDIVGSIKDLRQTKMFEVEGSNIEILNYIDTNHFLDGHCYEIYFSYTNKFGNKGILKFTRKNTFEYEETLSHETDEEMRIDSISVPDSDNRSKWSSNMAVPVSSKDKMGFYSYMNNALVVPKYNDVVPLSYKYFFCYIDNDHFDIIELADASGSVRNKEVSFLLENCEIVSRENDGKVIVFKDKNNKYGIYIADSITILSDMDSIETHKTNCDNSSRINSCFSLVNDGKSIFLYRQQIALRSSGYEELEGEYEEIKVYNNNNVSIAILKMGDKKYKLVIVSCFPGRPLVNGEEWKEFLLNHQCIFEEIIFGDNFIFLKNSDTGVSCVYSLKSGKRIKDFSVAVKVLEMEDRVIFEENDGNSYVYDENKDSLVKFNGSKEGVPPYSFRGEPINKGCGAVAGAGSHAKRVLKMGAGSLPSSDGEDQN